MLPTVTFDDPSGTYTFTLWRDKKKIVHDLKGLFVGLDVIPDDDYEETKNVTHCIYVKTYGNEEILIPLSEEEYDVLDPMVMDIEEKMHDNFYEREEDSDYHDAYREHPLDHE